MIIEIKEELTIGDVILEVGDKIEVLGELFDSNIPYTIHAPTKNAEGFLEYETNFEIDDIEYTVDIALEEMSYFLYYGASMSQEDFRAKVNLYNPENTKDSYVFFILFHHDKGDNFDRYAIQDTGNAFLVFATVGNIIKELYYKVQKDFNISMIAFQADKYEKSRVKLYHHFAKKMIKDLNYFDTYTLEGDTFLVYKKG